MRERVKGTRASASIIWPLSLSIVIVTMLTSQKLSLVSLFIVRAGVLLCGKPYFFKYLQAKTVESDKFSSSNIVIGIYLE